MTHLEQARAQVASRYPQDRHNIPRQAILNGHWDNGKLVRDALAQIEGGGV